MSDRYNNINNTSPYVSALKNDKNNIPTSDFDYSRAHHGNMNIGTLEILDCFPTLPKGQYTLSMDLLLKVRVALKKRIMTGQRVFVHAWYMSYNDLWEGAQNHIDHGRSGLLDINKPYTEGYIYQDIPDYPTPGIYPYKVGDVFTPNSPANQIGVPVRKIPVKKNSPSTNIDPLIKYMPALIWNHTNTTYHDFETKLNALPLAMYQRIYIDKYSPKNLIQNNKDALPDNAETIRIKYDATEINLLNKNGGDKCYISELTEGGYAFDYDFSDVNSSVYTLEQTFDTEFNKYFDTPVFLGIKRCRQKKGDYFVTSSPFADLLRGEAPTIDLAGFSANVDFSDVIQSVSGLGPSETVNGHINLFDDDSQVSIAITDLNGATKEQLINLFNRAKVSGNVQTNATANMLRTLIALTLIKERNALTNGDYNAMVKAQFGYSPNVDDYSAKYIGGFYQDISFSDVTQTSITQSSSPLGNQAGQAMSANSGFIGKFTSPDYGYIMIIASIVPDEIYNQGIPRFLGELSSDEEYTSPIQNNLPPQAIKYKEIYVSTDETKNEDVFSYTQRYEHLRHRENYASGFVGLGSSVAVEDSAYVQHKLFTSTPEFNAKFVDLIPQNVDMTPYAVQNEPPYIFTAISNVDKIEPLPYDSIPSDFGFKYA